MNECKMSLKLVEASVLLLHVSGVEEDRTAATFRKALCMVVH